MGKCCAPGCKSDSTKHTKSKDNITFHKFPKNQEITTAWINALKKPGGWYPSNQSRICSVHFTLSSMSETKSGRRKLLESAVPELNLRDDSSPSSSSSAISPEPKPKSASLETIRSDDTPWQVRLKLRLKNAIELAKRRRKRCNQLLKQRKRQQYKMASITEMLTELLTELREKDLISQEHKIYLKYKGQISAAQLFKRLTYKGKPA